MCGTSTLSKLSHHWPNTRKHWPVPHRPAHSWTNPLPPAPQQPAGLDRSAEHFTPDAPIPQWTRSHYMLYISFTWKTQTRKKTKNKTQRSNTDAAADAIFQQTQQQTGTDSRLLTWDYMWHWLTLVHNQSSDGKHKTTGCTKRRTDGHRGETGRKKWVN